MPETIVVTASAVVAAGPTIRASRTITVDAYDKLSVTVPDGSQGLEVELQPGTANAVRLLVITSSKYGDDLTYTVNADTSAHPLDEPHILTGAGAVALLDPGAATLSFTNGLGEDAAVQVLIGRDATA